MNLLSRMRSYRLTLKSSRDALALALKQIEKLRAQIRKLGQEPEA